VGRLPAFALQDHELNVAWPICFAGRPASGPALKRGGQLVRGPPSTIASEAWAALLLPLRGSSQAGFIAGPRVWPTLARIRWLPAPPFPSRPPSTLPLSDRLTILCRTAVGLLMGGASLSQPSPHSGSNALTTRGFGDALVGSHVHHHRLRHLLAPAPRRACFSATGARRKQASHPQVAHPMGHPRWSLLFVLLAPSILVGEPPRRSFTRVPVAPPLVVTGAPGGGGPCPSSSATTTGVFVRLKPAAGLDPHTALSLPVPPGKELVLEPKRAHPRDVVGPASSRPGQSTRLPHR